MLSHIPNKQLRLSKLDCSKLSEKLASQQATAMQASASQSTADQLSEELKELKSVHAESTATAAAAMKELQLELDQLHTVEKELRVSMESGIEDFQKLSVDKATAESEWASQLSTIHNSNIEANKASKLLQTEIERLQAIEKACTIEISSLKMESKQLRDANIAIEQKQINKTTTSSREEQLQLELITLHTTLDTLKSTEQALQADFEASKSTCDVLRKEVDDLGNAKNDLEVSLAELKAEYTRTLVSDHCAVDDMASVTSSDTSSAPLGGGGGGAGGGKKKGKKNKKGGGGGGGGGGGTIMSTSTEESTVASTNSISNPSQPTAQQSAKVLLSLLCDVVDATETELESEAHTELESEVHLTVNKHT